MRRALVLVVLAACQKHRTQATIGNDAEPDAKVADDTPRLEIVGTTYPGGTGYPIDVACGGDCTGKVTFSEGSGQARVTGTAGCSLRVGVEKVTLDKDPKRLAIDLEDAVDRGRMPDVLAQEIALDGTLACPNKPTRTVHLTFGAGAAVTAIWGKYQFAGAKVPPFDPFRDGKPKNLVTVFDSDQAMSGPTLEHDVVRWVGPPDDVANGVTYVGKVTELVQKRDTCSAPAGPVPVQRSGYAIDVYTYGKNTLVRKVKVAAPALDCSNVLTLPLVHLESGEDVRFARASGAAIDAAVKPLVE